MRIMIIGAGAIGGFLACRLYGGGHQVSVVARGDHLAAIKANGLRLLSPDGATSVAPVAASSDPGELGSQDLVITAVKAPALLDMLTRIRPILEGGVPVITAMNGVFWWYGHGLTYSFGSPNTKRLDPIGAISAAIPFDQAMGMVIHSTNQVIEPGLIQNRSSRNRFVVGAATAGGSNRAEELVAQLGVPGVDFKADKNARRAMWRKLLRNLSTAPSSVLTGGMAYDVINDPDAGQVARALFLEGAAVAAAHGFEGLELEADEVFAKGSGAHQKPSMSQDVDLGRPMEIDTILRIVQDFGRQCNVETPTLDTVTALVILRARLVGSYPS